MPVAEAAALARREPTGDTWHQQPLDPAADRAALEKLAAWCHRFSPLVGLEEADEPETLLLDVAGVAPLFGGAGRLSDQVQRSFQRLGLTTRLGLAETIGAAWAVAHFGQRPDDALQRLPVAALRLPAATVTTLQRLGLFRIGDLPLLPRVELQARLGPALLQRLDQALGQLDELLRPVQPPADFTVQWLFEHPAAQRESLEAAVGQLVERLCFLLRQQNRGALEIDCRLDCQTGPPVAFRFGLFQPSACVEHLLQLIDLQFERRHFPEPVVGASLRAARHGPLHFRQQELFDPSPRREDAWQVAALIDRLTGRLGRDAVLQCTLQSDPQPEKRARVRRFEPRNGGGRFKKHRATGRHPAAGSKHRVNAATPAVLAASAATGPQPSKSDFDSGSAVALDAGPSTLDAPLHFFTQPVRLQVLAVAPDGPPLRFEYHGRRHAVARHWGPERIETGWWRHQGVRRDYYRIETTTGTRFWLFRCLRTGGWFLQGRF